MTKSSRLRRFCEWLRDPDSGFRKFFEQGGEYDRFEQNCCFALFFMMVGFCLGGNFWLMPLPKESSEKPAIEVEAR